MPTQRIIGIDFGTSTSVIRVKRYSNGKPIDDKLNTKSVTFNMGATMVPTLIRKTESDTYYGFEAETNKRNSQLYQSFKVDLENDDSAQREKAKSLTTEFLKYLAKAYREQSDGGHLGDSSDEEKTIISYPVKWSEETKAFMISAAKEAGFPNVSGMNEAEAAIRAVTLQNEDVLQRKGYFVSGKPVNILLMDMGAGTSDLVLCRHTLGNNAKTEILCTYPKDGDILFGGREVDALLGQYITEQVPTENRADVLKRIGIEKYKAWKETVVSPELKKNNAVEEFSELETVMEYSDFETSFSINRAVFEDYTKNYLEKISELVSGCLEEANMSGNDIDLVILTGGHSQWYFVNEILCGKMAKFGDCGLTKIKDDNNRIISIALPQETVAIGLVYSNIGDLIEQKSPLNGGQLHLALREVQDYCENAKEIEGIIIGHSIGAATSAVASGWIPGAGSVLTTSIALGFTVSMYNKICSHFNIKVSKNSLKTIASVVVTKIAAYLGVIIAAEHTLTFIPGLGSISASVLAGRVNFAMVYIAGILFLKMMMSVSKVGKNINNMTEDELKTYIKKESTKDNISSAYKEAKAVYKTAKNDKSYQQTDIHPMD